MGETEILFFSEDVDFDIENPEKLQHWIEQVVILHQKEAGEINVIFCSDEYLLEMNRNHLKHDYYTDIITFDYSEDGQISGDLFISIDRVQDNSQSLQVDFKTELHRVIIHGILHLLGFKDKTEQDSQLMRAKEEEMMEILG
jgi:probable rRNA maturation factor